MLGSGRIVTVVTTHDFTVMIGSVTIVTTQGFTVMLGSVTIVTIVSTQGFTVMLGSGSWSNEGTDRDSFGYVCELDCTTGDGTQCIPTEAAGVYFEYNG